MGKRIQLGVIWCMRCNANHPLDEHLAKPRRTAVLEKITDIGDGVALTFTKYPKKRGPVSKADINQASIEMIEAPAAVAAEMERLGPDGIAKRKTERKKRTKAETQALIDAEVERKRALKSARQARWRAGLKKKAKRKKKP